MSNRKISCSAYSSDGLRIGRSNPPGSAKNIFTNFAGYFYELRIYQQRILDEVNILNIVNSPFNYMRLILNRRIYKHTHDRFTQYLLARFGMDDKIGNEVIDTYTTYYKDVLPYEMYILRDKSDNPPSYRWEIPYIELQMCPGECYSDGFTCKCDIRGFYFPLQKNRMNYVYFNFTNDPIQSPTSIIT